MLCVGEVGARGYGPAAKLLEQGAAARQPSFGVVRRLLAQAPAQEDADAGANRGVGQAPGLGEPHQPVEDAHDVPPAGQRVGPR